MKPSKPAIETALAEWLSLKVKANRASTKLTKDIQPFRETFEKKTKPFLEATNKKLQPINERLALLSKEIEKELRKGVDEEAGTIALAQVVAKLEDANLSALAEITKEDGDRVIDPKKFFDFVKTEERNAGFWGSLKVQIGKAEKFLGEKINQLAKKPPVFKFKISIPELEQQKGQKAA